MENKNYTVYKHTNKINGMVYVGSTGRSPKKRWKYGHGYKSCTKFYSAIQIYGWNNFKHDIVETNLTKEQAERLETETIAKFNSVDAGYNLTYSGQTAFPSEEIRKKLRLATAGNKNPMYGKKGEDAPG